MGEIEATGEIVTGALLGRALEPRAGEGHGQDEICLNCGTALIGPHCHRCGQSGHVHRSLGAIGHELVHGVFHFEGKLWRTLPLLAWQPGKLTRRYIDGERARFVSPIALFLFSIFTLFAVFSLAGITPPADIPADAGTRAANNTIAALERARTEAAAERAALPKGDAKAAELTERISGIDGQLKNIDRTKGFTADTGWHRLDHGIEKAMKNPALALYKLQSNSYKFSWLLIPLSLPFVWLMFAWKRRFHLYDHAVFVTYSIGFMSLLFIALTLLAAIGVPDGPLRLAGVIIVPVHIYRQLKDAYGLSRLGAVIRTILLLFSILFILLIFLLLILAMGVLG